MKNFKVLVAGGRDFNNYPAMQQRLDSLLRDKAKTHKIIIVSGKARGADNRGERYAKLRGCEVEAHPADWNNIHVEGAVIKENKHGKYNAIAGHMRNKDMAIACDVGVIFWDTQSSGTYNMINLLETHEKPMRVFDYSGKPILED